jgi:LysM repeat protein
VLLGDRGSRWRCLLVWASGTAVLGVVAVLLLPGTAGLWRTTRAPAAFDLLLLRVSADLVLGCACWAWLGLTVTVVEAWRGAPVRRRGPWRLPSAARGLVLAACGVALVSATVAPAEAAPPRPHHDAHGVGVLSGLPLPERAVAPRRPAPVEHEATHLVTVRPGDTLWAIAERALPDHSPDRVIAARWHTLYAANRQLIGPDPDVIQPGHHLHVPPLLPGKDRP